MIMYLISVVWMNRFWLGSYTTKSYHDVITHYLFLPAISLVGLLHTLQNRLTVLHVASPAPWDGRVVSERQSKLQSLLVNQSTVEHSHPNQMNWVCMLQEPSSDTVTQSCQWHLCLHNTWEQCLSHKYFLNTTHLIVL